MSGYEGKSKNNVNTTGPRFKGEKNALMVDYWSKRIVLGIARKFAQSEITEDGFQYDWKNPTKVTISHIDVLRLAKAVEKIKDGEETSLGINITSAGKHYALSIEKTEESYTLKLDIDLDEATRKSKSHLVYKFNKDFLLKNYDGETGKSDIIDIETEFEMFAICVIEFAKGATMAQAHTFNEAAKYNVAKNMANLGKIAGALNVDLGYGGKNNYNNKSTGNMNWSSGGGDDMPF